MPRRRVTVLASALLVAVLPVAGQAAHASAAGTAGLIVVRERAVRQPIEGFGVAEAFQRAAVIHGLMGLSAPKQKEVLDLLFSRTTGAGLSILRLGIGSSADTVYDHMHSIEPTDPGGPDATPAYQWDGADGGQVWLAQQARAYGVARFYADAWSAPGYMKTNGTDAAGGTLCGLRDTTCASGDWRLAYARYLVQYTRFYAQEGVHITDLAFTNEPDFTATYASMRFTPAQAAEFAAIVGPLAARAGVRLACCDATGWTNQSGYTTAIEADPQARRWVATETGHEYSSVAGTPLPTRRPTWVTEWGPSGSTWNENWDDGSGYDGLTVAGHIQNALTAGDVSAYIFWLGGSIGATKAFIQLDGDAYHVSKRLWAMAAFSRFIRPGAVRVDTGTGVTGLSVSAFRNADGSRVVEVLNTGTQPVTAGVAAGSGVVSTYLTDEQHALALVGTSACHGDSPARTFAPRSLTTLVIRGR